MSDCDNSDPRTDNLPSTSHDGGTLPANFASVTPAADAATEATVSLAIHQYQPFSPVDVLPSQGGGPESANRAAVRNKLLIHSLSRRAPADDQDGIASGRSDGPGENCTPGSSSAKALKIGDIPKLRGLPPKGQYTALELQIIRLKEKYPDCLLVVEVGYKYRLFGQDARAAAPILHLAQYLDRLMHTCSFPTHRFMVHVQKLVDHGFKVAHIRQTETAALKAAGDNRSAPFEREVSDIYTKGTMVVDADSSAKSKSTSSNLIMCVLEEIVSNTRVQCSFCSIQVTTGEWIYDTYDDDSVRSRTETRIHHLEPAEILFSTHVSSALKAVLNEATERSGMRQEALDFLAASPARDYVRHYVELRLEHPSAGGEQPSTTPASVELQKRLDSLSDRAVIPVCSLLKYLQQFKLDRLFSLFQFAKPFAGRGYMLLTADTLNNLELFRSADGGQEYGSLFWLLCRCRTAFGRRLLRRYLSQPLLELTSLRQRQDMIKELSLKNKSSVILDIVCAQFQHMPDLEQFLHRLYVHRSRPSEVIRMLQILTSLSNQLQSYQPTDEFDSPVLRDIFTKLIDAASELGPLLSKVNVAACEQNDKLNMFMTPGVATWFHEVAEGHNSLDQARSAFKKHLEEIRLLLKNPSLEYRVVSGIRYLIEIPASQVKKVPADWVRISATKTAHRFHTPFIIRHLKKEDCAVERLAAICENAFQMFLSEVSCKYGVLRHTVSSLAQLDVCLGLARVGVTEQWVFPEFVENKVGIIVAPNARHPVLSQLMPNYVPNDIQFEGSQKALLLTGPNMGGKSSYIRTVALMVILAQIGCPVPADGKAQFSLFDAVLTRMGASDDSMRGRSTFRRELDEASDVLHRATDRSLVILDELGRGTATFDGTAIAYVTLQWLVEQIRCVTLFVTHYPILDELTRLHPDRLISAHMACMEADEANQSVRGSNSASESTASYRVIFLYKLKPGLASRSYGLNVARLAGLPMELIENARMHSMAFEKRLLAAREQTETRFALFAETWRCQKMQLLHGVSMTNAVP
ncbi:hypothetical protein CXG81DRAFT_14192 [Caulochytrium protostelioides]|uniref:DNA mismatch repair protein MSH3 n=1 Tax=Caulochytrium protostelioides TaxID=1555241 RepID=A0A4V1ITS4_9FUNG|nr:hypothetical protein CAUPRSCDRAFT_5511 [Caulochytrium protostelioides]RKO99680.1 hypothetical protein CXG81DRAFT_14192 [Caulochytrium protostelioides]|eukprot:RKO99680.1 hypothetical protein CXG81DRAFT_14192 [Caulochytrium protostelioides]